jgi:His-Xaa-Ser system radical SAM maturase HxsB
MIRLPLRVRPLDDGVLFVGDTGRFFRAGEAFLDRLIEEEPQPSDLKFLEQERHLVEPESLGWMSQAYDLAQRWARPGALDYLILVPTLRCNLSCTYCQVSRAAINSTSHDWTPETLSKVLDFIDQLETPTIKIEFQGGEPLLRPDLIAAVIDRCERFSERSFVICTNLSVIPDAARPIIDRTDVCISTSIDGDWATHQRNRTAHAEETSAFATNLDGLIRKYGAGKVSALPTIDPDSPPEIDALIDAYASRGLYSIFLRPVSFHGFARKRHADSRDQTGKWAAYHRAFVRRLIERNWTDRGRLLDESYLTLVLKRIFQAGLDGHVDLRNPNVMGIDYLVIDHDGCFYPTDEARMLTRSGVVDLSIGNVHVGIDHARRDALNAHATNQYDPDCLRCTYQPFCGRDVIDDLARYGTIDIPRRETAFCRKHLDLFDFAFSLIYSDDPPTQYSVRGWLGVEDGAVPLGARHI